LVDFTALQRNLVITFKEQSLLEQAVVHSSYINENPGFNTASNERLEFLGDAVLGFIIAEKLYHEFPDITEGEMTRLRSVIVRRDTLASIAKAIKLGDYLYLGKGEEASGGRNKSTNLAGGLEAVIAAIFLDQGLTVTRDAVLRLTDNELQKLIKQDINVDFKSQLQELIQSRYQSTPTYRLIEASGPDHDKMFKVEVMANETVLGRGSGRSKKVAETEAARSALKKLSANFTQ
jgi:ribonuclease-3